MEYNSDGDDVLVISQNGEHYIMRPEDSYTSGSITGSNMMVDRMESALTPISPTFNKYVAHIDGYISGAEDALLVDPQSIAGHVPPGNWGRVVDGTGVHLKNPYFSSHSVLEFDDELSGGGNDVVLSSRQHNWDKAELVGEDVTLDLDGDLIDILEPRA